MKHCNRIRLLGGVGLSILLICCGKGNEESGSQGTSMLSESSVIFEAEESIRKVILETSESWQIQGSSDWCELNKKSGNGKDTITISATRNIFRDERTSDYIIKTANGDVADLKIRQRAAKQDFLYQLPVIFHILYMDENNINQNISADFLTGLLPFCNQLYRHSKNGIDTGVEFILAESDPLGNVLKTPGIERIKWEKEIDEYDFIQSQDRENVALLWDPSRYVNIVIFPFQKNGLTGISKMPLTVTDNPLKGLIVGDFYFTHPLDLVQCVALNTHYVIRPEAGNILTHELGHYLGLFHAFSSSPILETDYCGDTPNYNREDYMKKASQIIHEEGNTSLRLYERTGDDGSTFISRNIMDYEYTYQDEFTNDQYKRIRHVLENSPLIPGPKKGVLVKR